MSSAIAKQVLRLIREQPDNWEFGAYRYVYKDASSNYKNLQLWISSGPSHLHLHESPWGEWRGVFSWWERRAIWRELKALRESKAEAELRKW